MNEKIRPVIAVVAAEVNSTEQRQILSGIVEQAQEYGMDTAVISNIFNPNTPGGNDEIDHENFIYDMINSDSIDGLIFISESFVNAGLKERIKQLLIKRKELPIIAVGTRLSELSELDLRYINSDEERDIEDLTDHLIDVHGFTDIDMLTGYDHLEASHIRVSGYRRSLEKHGIKYDESKVHFGNFWINSGEELAEKYISGSLDMPQAVICANDYMAYGILDKLIENSISVPEAVTVVGYEYIWERIYHSPLLTTYQRNRAELGRNAVQILFGQLSGKAEVDFSPPRGTLICGASCPCKKHSISYLSEIKKVNEINMYSEWMINSSMDRMLTACSDIEEFSAIMGNNSFLIRYVQNMFLCLYEKWYDDEAAEQDVISCRSVLPWLDTSTILIHKYDIARIFAKSETPAVYYFSPLFFNKKSFGYTILKYDKPDTYDITYKTWIKSLSNALEFIRMKSDIRYFTAYDKLSEQYDPLTGIYNANGLEYAVKYAVKNFDNSKKVVLIMAKFIPPGNFLDILDKHLAVLSEISDCMKELSNGVSDLFGRIDRNLFCFAAIIDSGNDIAVLLEDKLRIMITYGTSCVKEWGIYSFVTSFVEKSINEFDYSAAFSEAKDILNQKEKAFEETKLIGGYSQFLECRNKICLTPQENHTIGKMCTEFGFSEGHFRRLYKESFGISFHQDCLNYKIDYAKYLIITTSLDINSVSSECGYIDTKYFMRIFRKSTSLTAKQYRDIFKGDI